MKIRAYGDVYVPYCKFRGSFKVKCPVIGAKTCAIATFLLHSLLKIKVLHDAIEEPFLS